MGLRSMLQYIYIYIKSIYIYMRITYMRVCIYIYVKTYIDIHTYLPACHPSIHLSIHPTVHLVLKEPTKAARDLSAAPTRVGEPKKLRVSLQHMNKPRTAKAHLGIWGVCLKDALYGYKYVLLSICMYACMHVCTYVCMCKCMDIYIRLHIHIYI